jgi:predicted negative regulator of RcsB-dependent stress response
MDRQHRHDLKHDKFVDEIGALSVRAKANQRGLLSIAIGALVIALGVYGFYFYRSNKEDKAQLALATAIETIEAPVGEDPQQQQQAPATAPRFKTADERNAAAEKQFRDVQAQFGGTDAADVAGLFLARLAVTRGDATNARKGLEDFIDDHGDHPLLGASARYSLYQLRIENGEAAQVATELTTELSKAEPALPGDAILVLLAQAYDVQGNGEKSRETYRRITTEYPDSQYAVEAARRAGQA